MWFVKSNLEIVVLSLDAPKLRKTASDIELLAGESFTFLCSAVAGSEPFKFEWFRNALPLREENYKIQSFDNSNSLLKITSVDITDAGNYTCRVSNPYGFDMISTILIIKSKAFSKL